MGLREIVEKSVSTAFNAVGNLKVTIDYYSVSTGTGWDSSTGKVPVSATPIMDIPAVMGKLDEQELLTQFSQVGSYVDPSGQKVSAAKLIIEALKLNNIRPAKDDYFILNGTKWYVVQIESPVQSFIWKLAVRSDKWKPAVK